MKRKAPQVQDSVSPDKISKESSDNPVSQGTDLLNITDATKEPISSSQRLSSGRQRKAPAWLSSYITDGSTVKESPKPATSKVSTSSSPAKKKVQKSQRDEEVGHSKLEEPTSLRRGSTLKIEDSSPPPTKSKKSFNTLIHSVSLNKKDTVILNSPVSESEENSEETKADSKSARMKLLAPGHLRKSPLSHSSSSSHPSHAVPKPLSKSSSKQHITSIHSMNADELSISNVVEVCDTKSVRKAVSAKAARNKSEEESETSKELLEKPKMLEVVICISTSGAMTDYLTVLQEKTRDLVWRLQSLIPDLRIGVLAHTQGGIHDDKPGSGSSSIDHNYIRTGGHSGTKWLDLGATFSQICAFVDSLEPEATVYPDYVQDNLEMALWKLQRCMSWSSCSYRTVLMVGRGRPNRTSFYLQREHWRGWIRSALEIGPKAEIPVIDWELEAKLLAQMGIHIFTIHASSPKTLTEEEEDEGSTFFKRVAEITNGLHIRLTEASHLIDIMVGVCCACHGPDLLQNHRDTLRDENDGLLPLALKDIFVSLQLHSKRRSLSTIPSLVGDLSVLQKQLAKADANGNVSGSEEEEPSEDEQIAEVKSEANKGARKKKSAAAAKNTMTKSQNGKTGQKSSSQAHLQTSNKGNKSPLKSSRLAKKLKSPTTASKMAVKAAKTLKGAKIKQKDAKNLSRNKKMSVKEKDVLSARRAKATLKKVQTKRKNEATSAKNPQKSARVPAKPAPAPTVAQDRKVENIPNDSGDVDSSTQNNVTSVVATCDRTIEISEGDSHA